MNKSQGRLLMIKALKEFVVPSIKAHGFTGTFPHFRKRRDDKLEFISFQFRREGGSYVVEAGKIKEENMAPFFKQQKFEKLNYGISNERIRLGSSGKGSDHWFFFENFNSPAEFNELAKDTERCLPQAIEFLK